MRITSPNYPDEYPHQTTVIWTVLAEPGQTIVAYITDFDMEVDNAACSRYDYLEFR